MSFFIKNPGTKGFIAWHQDAPLGGPSVAGRVVTAWIALTSSTLANGCMQVVKGSHGKMLEHIPSKGDNLLANSQEISVSVSQEDATPIELQPGQFSFHHDQIVHGSEANHSQLRRVGIAVRYTTPFDRGARTSETATLVRGMDAFNCFLPENEPVGEMMPDDLLYRDAVVQRLRKAKGMVAAYA
jgi:ectoine hydroxylase-related dioxygenase (phytanoyl-CoA dioxygenase family)